MKRIAILLTIMFALAWIGAKISGPGSGAKATANVQQTQPTPPVERKPLTPAEEKAQQEKWFGADAIVAGKRAVKSTLKDHDSAEFKDVYANYTETHGVVACGQVNAKNSFGAYTGFKAFVSNGKTAILEGRDDIKKAWDSACR